MTAANFLQQAVQHPEGSPARSILLDHARRADLRERILSCTACDLHTTANAPVPWEGHVAPVAIIGEAPGSNEDRHGRPFVGAAGRLLESVLAGAGLSRSSVVLINSICCRPPSNNFDLAVKADAPARCAPFLDEQIAISGAWILVPVGNRAMNAILPDYSAPISQMRGQPKWREHHLVVPTYHPAYALRNKSAKSLILDDLHKVRRIIDGEAEAPVPKKYDPSRLLSEMRDDTFSEDDRRRFAAHFKKHDWVQAYSTWLEDKVVLTRDENTRVPDIEGVRYTVRELAQLSKWNRNWADARRLHFAKKEFDGVLI